MQENDGEQRAQDTFCKSQTEVGAYFKLHAEQSEKAAYRCECAGRDGFCGLGNCRGKRLFGVKIAAKFGAVLVQKEYRIVHAEPELQNCAAGKRNYRSRREYDVRAHVDDYGNHHCEQKNYGFDEGIGGDEQDNQNDYTRDETVKPDFVETVS